MRAVLKFTVQTAAAIFSGLAILFAAGAWRLSSGPVSLGFLAPYVEEAFEAEDLPYRVEFEDTVLTWAGWDRSLDVRAINVRTLTKDGQLVATVPEVSLGLSGLSLIDGVIAPTEVELMGARVDLVRDETGKVRLAVGDTGGDGSDEALDQLIADLLAPPRDDHPFGKLRRVSIIGADLTMDDLLRGISWRAPGTDLILDLDEEGISGQLTLKAEVGEETLELQALALYDRASETAETAVQFSALTPDRLVRYAPELAGIEGIAVPISGTLSFGLNRAFEVDGVDFDLSGGAGEIDLPDVFPNRVPVRRIVAKGSVDRLMTSLTLRKLEVVTDRPTLSLSGTISETAAGVGVQGTFAATDMPFKQLGNYWPEGLVGGGRSWILLNVTDGVISRFDAALDIKPGQFANQDFTDESVNGTFAFQDISVTYLHPMPPVVGVDGTARFTGSSLELDMTDGTIDGITAPRGTARLTDILSDQPHMVTVVEAAGAAREALELLDHPRLGLISKLGLRPDQVGGDVRTEFSLSFPLISDVTFDQIAVMAVAQLRDTSVADLFGRIDMAGGVLTASLDSNGLEIAGDIAIEGAPATITWREAFADDAPFRSRYEVSMALTEAAQGAFGLDFGAYAAGDFAMDLVYTSDDRGAPRATVFLDALNAELRVPELFWSKPTGEEGWVRLTMLFADDGTIGFPDVEIQSSDFHAQGSALLEPDFAGIRYLEARRLQHGVTDVAARIVPGRGGAPTEITVTGESVDLRPYLESLTEEGAGEPAPFTLSLSTKRAITRANQQITDVQARVINTAEGLRRATLEGTLVTGKLIHANLEPEGGKRRLVVRSDDAGAVSRAFDVYDNALGGTLDLQVVLHDDVPGEPVTGVVRIEDYRVINAPTLAELLSIALLTGILDALQGEGIAFSRFEMPFEITGDILTITDAKTSGPAIGITANGTVDLATEATDLSGTIVPAYAINSILGEVPLIGEILIGGEGEGLFAATYAVDGPLEEPTITVNPLAALAPGFLRNLFNIFEDSPDGSGPGDAATQRSSNPGDPLADDPR